MAEYSLGNNPAGIVTRASAVLTKVTAVWMSPFSAFFYIAVSSWDLMALMMDSLLQVNIAGMILTREKKALFLL